MSASLDVPDWYEGLSELARSEVIGALFALVRVRLARTDCLSVGDHVEACVRFTGWLERYQRTLTDAQLIWVHELDRAISADRAPDWDRLRMAVETGAVA